MTTYKVTFEVELDSETAFDAALEVESWLTRPYFRPAFVIENQDTYETELVDLETYDLV